MRREAEVRAPVAPKSISSIEALRGKFTCNVVAATGLPGKAREFTRGPDQKPNFAIKKEAGRV